MSEDKFNRSQFLKSQHQRARTQREKYKDIYGVAPEYSSFLRKETPLEANIRVYEVSYQVSYRGSVDAIESTAQTFTVVSFAGQQQDIYQRTMNMIIDSKGKSTNANFRPNTIDAIENNTNINITPRGMEQTDKKPSKEQINELLEKGFSVSQLDKVLKFENKKGRQGEMNLDITHFM